MDAAAIESLIEARSPEAQRLEFKRELPGSKESEKKEFLADVSAMANASGGHILYGVSESDGCADAITGIVDPDLGEVTHRLQQLISSGIEPRLSGISFEVIAVGDAKIVVVEVPQSLLRPHWVSAYGDRRFYIRHHSEKLPMSIDEIRSAFIQAAGVQERALQWSSARIAALTSQEFPQSKERTIWTCIHVIPFAAFSGYAPPRFNVVVAPNDMLPSVRHESVDPRPNYLGVRSTLRDGSRLIEYLQIYRDFRIEAVFPAGEEVQGRPILWQQSNEHLSNRWLKRLATWMDAQAYPFPAIVQMSVLGCEGAVIQSLNGAFQWRTAEKTLVVEPVSIESSSFDPNLLLKPAYDHVWQSFGRDGSPNYTNGEWKPDPRGAI